MESIGRKKRVSPRELERTAAQNYKRRRCAKGGGGPLHGRKKDSLMCMSTGNEEGGREESRTIKVTPRENEEDLKKTRGCIILEL